MKNNKKCKHDYENPVHKGRAKYICRKCNQDITMVIVLTREMELYCGMIEVKK